MADKVEKTFQFVVVGGGIAGVTCVEQVNKHNIKTCIYELSCKGNCLQPVEFVIQLCNVGLTLY